MKHRLVLTLLVLAFTPATQAAERLSNGYTQPENAFFRAGFWWSEENPGFGLDLHPAVADRLVAAARERVGHAHDVARQTGLPDSALTSQIIPVILGDEARTMATASALQQQGFDIRGIRPPTVPKGTSRLRVSITGNVAHEDISALFATIASYQSEAA